MAAARGGDVDLQKAVGSLIATEKAYAKLAGEKGFRAASISVFADDAVIFTPNPVTIWRKDANGVWQVALDVGIDHPLPSQAENESEVCVPSKPLANPESASPDLDKVQSHFTQSLKEDEADAIIDHATDDIRVYRRGQLPAVGKSAAKKMLAEENAETTRAPLGAGTSHPIDLAYEYGEYTSEHDNTKQRGIYLCIWQLESDGAWKLALDLQKSAPENNP